MALVIHLKKNQQLIINGAVLENASSRTISLLLKNEAAVLRQDDVLTPEAAITPASRTYYALQCVYLFPEERGRHLPNFKQLLESYVRAAPSAHSIAEDIETAVESGRYYAALKRAQALIRHEGQVLDHGEQHDEEPVPRPSPRREPTPDRSMGAGSSCAADEGRRRSRG